METPSRYKKMVKSGKVDDEIMCHVLDTLTNLIGGIHSCIVEVNNDVYEDYKFLYDNTEDLRRQYDRDVKMLYTVLKGYVIVPTRVKVFEHPYGGKRYYLEYDYPNGVTYMTEISRKEYKECYTHLPLSKVEEWDIPLHSENDYSDGSRHLSLHFMKQVVELLKNRSHGDNRYNNKMV